ncbi:hypothetical protein XELAEV_18034019mg [Xenopus laevis]|uniref:Uncharacterized protein n=1 Tax=Xenopus laevis TaxID=8355 RepID=A0A974HEH8_XENLA|nr:hypothetical protein XELAEV_18034019mg [Xenopus laevis]
MWYILHLQNTNKNDCLKKKLFFPCLHVWTNCFTPETYRQVNLITLKLLHANKTEQILISNLMFSQTKFFSSTLMHFLD